MKLLLSLCVFISLSLSLNGQESWKANISQPMKIVVTTNRVETRMVDKEECSLQPYLMPAGKILITLYRNECGTKQVPQEFTVPTEHTKLYCNQGYKLFRSGDGVHICVQWSGAK